MEARWSGSVRPNSSSVSKDYRHPPSGVMSAPGRGPRSPVPNGRWLPSSRTDEWEFPRGGTPSTHILKPQGHPGPDGPQIVDIVSNEAFCMRLAAAAGCHVASVAPRLVGTRWVLFVERFDRTPDRGVGVRRIHQEDLAQASGTVPTSKYEEDGGISLVDAATTYGVAGVGRIVASRHLLAAIVVAAATGNADQDAKNLGVLYGDQLEPAPLYDLVSTVVYEDLSRRSAFRIGSEIYVDEVHDQACIEASAIG